MMKEIKEVLAPIVEFVARFVWDCTRAVSAAFSIVIVMIGMYVVVGPTELRDLDHNKTVIRGMSLLLPPSSGNLNSILEDDPNIFDMRPESESLAPIATPGASPPPKQALPKFGPQHRGSP